MGKIFYIMGKSSSGKDTIYKEMKKRHPQLRTIVPYTTRPIREGEKDGVEYFFTDDATLEKMQKEGRVIEVRSYHTRCGIWTYFTADDGQIDLEHWDYIVIGTLESYRALRKYFGESRMVPVYIEVEDGLRLMRALERERRQERPQYAEMCRRFLADCEDFSEENLRRAGIRKVFENNSLEECIGEIEKYIGV
ncbi:MAG TPA: guanylate kinase [Candidatus Mediterraneibacter cottocaccae]|nr:guanylate kinase [Candidatus Mediterraneibacter cottocaccae]